MAKNLMSSGDLRRYLDRDERLTAIEKCLIIKKSHPPAGWCAGRESWFVLSLTSWLEFTN
jgi:hypothetical protein